MVNEVSDEVVGFGPIEFLLKDPSVTEVTDPEGLASEDSSGGRRATRPGGLGSPGRRNGLRA